MLRALAAIALLAGPAHAQIEAAWEPVPGAPTDASTLAANDVALLIATENDGTLLRTLTDGGLFTTVDTGIDGPIRFGATRSLFWAVPQGEDVFASELRVSLDQGETWAEIDPKPVGTELPSELLSELHEFIGPGVETAFAFIGAKSSSDHVVYYTTDAFQTLREWELPFSASQLAAHTNELYAHGGVGTSAGPRIARTPSPADFYEIVPYPEVQVPGFVTLFASDLQAHVFARSSSGAPTVFSFETAGWEAFDAESFDLPATTWFRSRGDHPNVVGQTAQLAEIEVSVDGAESFERVDAGVPAQAEPGRLCDQPVARSAAAATTDKVFAIFGGYPGPCAEPGVYELLVGTGSSTAGEAGPGETVALAVWPSPATSRVTVEAGAAGELAVVDALGRAVARRTVAAGRTSLDVSALAPGAYALVLRTAEGVTARRLSVAR